MTTWRGSYSRPCRVCGRPAGGLCAACLPRALALLDDDQRRRVLAALDDQAHDLDAALLSLDHDTRRRVLGYLDDLRGGG